MPPVSKTENPSSSFEAIKALDEFVDATARRDPRAVEILKHHIDFWARPNFVADFALALQLRQGQPVIPITMSTSPKEKGPSLVWKTHYATVKVQSRTDGPTTRRYKSKWTSKRGKIQLRIEWRKDTLDEEGRPKVTFVGFLDDEQVCREGKLSEAQAFLATLSMERFRSSAAK